ncbi:hypothetical protein LPC04_24435 [Comamonadaceae bacterium BS-T2-15]|uniref:SCP domain-containing protein n=2 Tax=Scleromatobacter humisilvae TaxID=2897159 RepID=A0A9X1YNR6_9BURK|nr:hypothetical protein [Scleromatobacter humisilvae]
MDQAAQSHAAWMVTNDSFTHDEVSGTPGFTGVNWARRDEAFGYVPIEGSEVMAQGPASAGVDILVNSAYHRAALLAFEPVDVGVGRSGASAASVTTPLVIDLTKPGYDTVRGAGQSAQPSINGVAVWPLDGASNVPLRLGNESPNPVPTQDVLTLGTPASLNVAEGQSIAATQFTLTNVATGNVVPTHLLTNANDPNFATPESFIAAVPLAPLSPGTTYRVVFSGSTRQFPTGAIQSVNRTWSFTTGSP